MGRILAIACCCTVLTAAEMEPEPAMTNQLFVIQPYWHQSTWVFDDAGRGLQAEPFVLGIDEMITELVGDIPDARAGFRLIFSPAPIPGHQVAIERQREEAGGWWYRRPSDGKEGWLCPALFKFFDVAPERLYARAQALPSAEPPAPETGE